MVEIPSKGKFELLIDSTSWRYICAKLGFSSRELAHEMGFLGGRIDAVLSKGKLTGPAASCLAHICRYYGCSVAELLREAGMLLTLPEFAQECRVSYTTVRRWVKSGLVEPTVKEPYTLVHQYEVINYLKRKAKCF